MTFHRNIYVHLIGFGVGTSFCSLRYGEDMHFFFSSFSLQKSQVFFHPLGTTNFLFIEKCAKQSVLLSFIYFLFICLFWFSNRYISSTNNKMCPIHSCGNHGVSPHW